MALYTPRWIAGAALWLLACAPQAVATTPQARERSTRVAAASSGTAPAPALPAAPVEAVPAQAVPAAAAAAPATATSTAEPADEPAVGSADRVQSLAIPEIDALVARALAEHRMPGCVVAIGRRAGLLFLRAYGQRALVPAQLPMEEDTIFDLASLTKPVATASAVIALAEQGKLRIEERASRYLTELDRPSTRSISVRQLLLHSAGLPTEDSMRHYERGPEAGMQALLGLHPLLPADAFSYSDVGYLWLGELVRRVAGQPLDVFTRERLFAPLGMTDTLFQPPQALLPRIAPTEVTDDRGVPHALIHGVVHDPRAYRLGGVAGNAGLFSSARDLARYARMLLGGGELEGKRVLEERSVAALTRPIAIGEDVRTLGWDVHTKYSRLRGTLLSERAFGHGGFTGTSLWIDPGKDLFVIFLSNRVHPEGKSSVIGLAGAIADAAVRAAAHGALPADMPRVLTGIDVLRSRGFAELQGKRIGLLTHTAATAADGRSTLELLKRAEGVRLAAVFSPEHGLDASQEGLVRSSPPSASAARGAKRQPTAEVPPVYSLYGETRRPSSQMLAGLDLIVVDLVDVGARFYTYMSTLHELLRAAGAAHLPVLVLDRPNPIGGVAVEGPVLDDGVRSFVNYFPLPVRHGMTAGELAAMFDAEEALGATLDVIEVRGWCRDQLFEQTGLTWTNPSPNLRSPEAALLYPGIALLEGTNLSVGRGTEQPFMLLGAPFIDAQRLSAELARAALAGLRITATSFTPNHEPYAGKLCHGVRFELLDARAFAPVHAGLAIAHALRALYPDAWQAQKMGDILGHAQTLQGLLAGSDLASLEQQWQPALTRFLERRRGYLRYHDCQHAR
jgi:uncharacterized protein YbbC (DUF1343 family)